MYSKIISSDLQNLDSWTHGLPITTGIFSSDPLVAEDQNCMIQRSFSCVSSDSIYETGRVALRLVWLYNSESRFENTHVILRSQANEFLIHAIPHIFRQSIRDIFLKMSILVSLLSMTSQHRRLSRWRNIQLFGRQWWGITTAILLGISRASTRAASRGIRRRVLPRVSRHAALRSNGTGQGHTWWDQWRRVPRSAISNWSFILFPIV